jgi:hypothetical protein
VIRRKLLGVKTAREALATFRSNIPILALLLLLVIARLAGPASHNRTLEFVALILIVKAESRPQPIGVVLLALAATATSVGVLFSVAGTAPFFEWLTVALVIPLVFSRWVFRPREE